MNCNTVILGGGVAGWLTALVIKKSKPGMNIIKDTISDKSRNILL